MDRRVYEIWLSLACTPDTATFPKLIEHFESAEEIYLAGDKEIRSVLGSNTSDCTRLVDKDLTRAQGVYNFCTSKGVGLLSYYDDEFPESLRSIQTPPVLLYYRGKLPDFTKGFMCAIVGTRSLSEYGRNNAFHLGYDMGKAGATVVSGMAIGIDGVALAGALAAGATTIAVLGSGIDVCYPAIHLRLAQEIVKNGCVMTEYAPGTRPERHNFPKRNRIISGLCRATVLVEGSDRSGALITASYAKKQGRTVFAYPGNVGSPGSQAAHLLIKHGAQICTAADDVVYYYENDIPQMLNPAKLPIKREVKMHEVLAAYRVSAVTPTDDIFRPSRPKRVAENGAVASGTETSPAVSTETEESQVPSFDKETLRIYKKIPMDCECSIESLADEKTDLRTVMKLLLKLEMSKAIVMLAGEKVKRNIN